MRGDFKKEFVDKSKVNSNEGGHKARPYEKSDNDSGRSRAAQRTGQTICAYSGALNTGAHPTTVPSPLRGEGCRRRDGVITT